MSRQEETFLTEADVFEPPHTGGLFSGTVRTDHTERDMERHSVAAAYAACPKPLLQDARRARFLGLGTLSFLPAPSTVENTRLVPHGGSACRNPIKSNLRAPKDTYTYVTYEAGEPL